MTRPLRIEHAGGWCHITARGNERKEIYRDERDRAHFLERWRKRCGGWSIGPRGIGTCANNSHN
jgi:hypothetical protein